MNTKLNLGKVVVTGGAGFIGSHIVEELCTHDCEIVVVDDFSTGKKENIAPFSDRVTLCEGSILDSGLLREALTGAKFVLHHAAIASVPRSIDEPLHTNEVNVSGTLSVLVAARDAGVRRVVYASSSAVYGDSEELPKKEDMPMQPLSPYAAHKSMNEYYGNLFSRLYNLETVGLRYFNVFGPRQDVSFPYSGVISLFVKILGAGTPPTIFGDGETARDFVYVKDVVRSCIRALTAEGVSGEVFNIGSGEETTINRLAELINRQLGKDITPKYGEAREGEVKRSGSNGQNGRLLFPFKYL